MLQEIKDEPKPAISQHEWTVQMPAHLQFTRNRFSVSAHWKQAVCSLGVTLEIKIGVVL